ncbi:MAG TPA: succinate dehydrogenase [Rhodobacteraceae bacterium]|nr:succinate dehydrogenase [Paracoccaceae bacterium]
MRAVFIYGGARRNGRDNAMIKPHRHHALWFAYMLHRLSGLGLAVFLPVHFYVLSLALTKPAALDSFLLWSEMPIVKLAEFGLVFLLAVHIFGGLRLMALEWLPWSPNQKALAASAIAGAFLLSTIFFLQAI